MNGGGAQVAVDGDAFSTVGEWLAARREALGRSLGEAEEATRVREDYLDAIETMDPRRMPVGPYAPGFVRTYAIYLDLDPEAVTERFRSEMSPRRARRLQLGEDRSPRRITVPPQLIFGAVAAAAAVGLVYLGLRSSERAAENVVPAVPEGLTEWVEADVTSERSSAAPEIVGGPELVLRARVPVWLEARVADGEALVSRQLAAGETWTAPRIRGVLVSADNGGAVEILRDGTPDGRLGAPGLPVSGWNADAARGLAPPEPEEPVEAAPEDDPSLAAAAPVTSVEGERVSARVEAAAEAEEEEPDEADLISPELPTDSDAIIATPLPYLFVGDVTPPSDGAEEDEIGAGPDEEE